MIIYQMYHMHNCQFSQPFNHFVFLTQTNKTNNDFDVQLIFSLCPVQMRSRLVLINIAILLGQRSDLDRAAILHSKPSSFRLALLSLTIDFDV